LHRRNRRRFLGRRIPRRRFRLRTLNRLRRLSSHLLHLLETHPRERARLARERRGRLLIPWRCFRRRARRFRLGLGLRGHGLHLIKRHPRKRTRLATKRSRFRRRIPRRGLRCRWLRRGRRSSHLLHVLERHPRKRARLTRERRLFLRR